MKKQYKLGVIGCGFMAEAILKGVVLSDFLRSKKIIVSDISEENLKKAEELGVHITGDNKFVAENCEFLLLAVRPQDFSSVVESLQGFRPKKVISVMAGVKKNTIKNAFGVGLIKVARCTPNLPCCIGSGIICIDMTDFNKSKDDTDFIYNFFANLGTVVSVDESKMDAGTALSGSGPAYVFMFIDSLIEAGVKLGLPRGEAKILAVQTVLGSAEMVQREENTVNELLMQVCSKGGTSIEAVKVFENGGFRKLVGDAVDACANRAKELSDK